jgi:hypothetical protein
MKTGPGKMGFLLLAALLAGICTAADTVLEVYRTDAPPVIDGILDEPMWQSALKITGFKTFEPDYHKDPSDPTEVFMAYDQDHFYFGYRCFDKNPRKIKASVTRRDNMFEDDFVGVVIDTFNDHQSGYGFLVNPLGIQGDGMMNIQGDLDGSHDMVWYSQGRIDDEGYTVECKIPFKSIRFPGKKKIVMGIGFFRNFVRQSETASFPPISPQGGFLSQFLPVLISGIKYKRVVEILPGFTHTRQSSLQSGELETDTRKSELSLTAKVGLTSELTFDGTVNPDFSQVEADAGQVDVNLRYALFYSEKRPFFLEGNEIFQFAGNTEEAPLWYVVHTRNIVDPAFGLKLTGKLGRRNTIAGIYARDAFTNGDGREDASFSIFRLRHSVGQDSYLGGFYTSRYDHDSGGVNRVYGTDGRIRLYKNGVAEFHLLGSDSKDETGGVSTPGHACALRFTHDTRTFITDMGVQDVSTDFRVDTGFLTRPGITRLALFSMYRIYPRSKIFQRIEPFYWSFHIYDKYSDMWETFNLFTLRFQLPRQTMLRLDFILANEVFAGQRFDISGLGFQGYSQISKSLYIYAFFRHTKNIYYDAEAPYGGKSSRASLSLIYQPTEKLNSSLDVNYTDFYRREDGEKIYDYAIVRSRTTFQLNKYLFFRGIVEYNDFYKKLTLDLLASFTYIPGTVIHLGYGSAFEKIRWQDPDYLPSNRFLESKRGLFFKISYLWRL